MKQLPEITAALLQPLLITITQVPSSEKKLVIMIKKLLEIWGKAQRESAQCPKSDWGKLGGVKFPRHQSHMPRTQMHWHTPNAHCRLRVGQHERL